MNEYLVVPSSSNQANQVLAEIEALLLRESGTPDVFGSKMPDIPQGTMPKFIIDRLITPSFEGQVPASDAFGVEAYTSQGLDARGTVYDPLASVSFSREYNALYTNALAGTTYNVIRTSQGETGLKVASDFDVASHIQGESQENAINTDLLLPQDFLDKQERDPFAAQRELENHLNTPSITDLILTEEQKAMLEPVDVSFGEADLLISFLHNLHRS
jgi:hypothetical protein